MVLRHPAPDQVDAGNARDAKQARLDGVARHLPQFGLRPAGRAGQAQADDREGRERQAVDAGGGGGRQRRADLRQAAVDVQLGRLHLHAPVEEDVDLRRAAPGGRADGDHAGDVLHRLLDGAGDRRHHLVGGHHAVVDQDDDAREVGLREDRRRHRPRRERPGQAQGDGEEQDGPRLPDDEAAEARGRRFGGMAHERCSGRWRVSGLGSWAPIRSRGCSPAGRSRSRPRRRRRLRAP